MAGEFEGLMDRMKAIREPAPEPELEPDLAPEQELDFDPEPAPEPVATEDDGLDAAPEDEGEPLQVSTLEDISKALDVPISDLYNIAVPMSVDGERVEVKLGDWKDDYQNAQRLSAKEQQIQRRAQEADAAVQQWSEMYSKAEANAKVWIDMIESEEKSIDWKALREDDPTEYVAKRQEFQDRKAGIQARVGELEQQRMQAMQTQQAEYQRQQSEILARERDQLLRKLPSWKDESVASKERTELSKFLAESGFSSDEIAGVTDHRAILLARDAMRYRQAQQRATTGKRQPKSKAPIVKPGARAQRKTQAQELADALRGRLKKSGRIQDALALRRAGRRKG